MAISGAVARFQRYHGPSVHVPPRSRIVPTTLIVIPTYNRLRFLTEALASVFGQSRRPDEIIVVDDGSNDGTAEAMARLTDQGVRYVRQQNAGPSAARNRGMREATSEWIAFLDSDDLWLPHRLARQCEFLAQ